MVTQMSFNFIPITLDETIKEETLPVICEPARNLKTLELLTKNGDFYLVEKNDAIKIWILKALNKQTERYSHRAYSRNYGNEITKLFGRHLKDSLLKSEIKRYIEEALLVNPYIKEISNFTFEKKGSQISATFTVSTIYGNFEQDINYGKEQE